MKIETLHKFLYENWIFLVGKNKICMGNLPTLFYIKDIFDKKQWV